MLIGEDERHVVGLLDTTGSDMLGLVVYDGHHNEYGWVWIRCASDMTLDPVLVHPSRLQPLLPDSRNWTWQFFQLPGR
jgi:hypothetical protein